MKKGKFTLAIAFTALLAACSKENQIETDLTGQSVSTRASRSSATVTGWESGYNWSRSDSSDYQVYAYNRATAEVNADVLNGGVVLVYVKNVPMTDGRRMEKPMLVPFHVLPPVGRPGYDQVWYRVISAGNITVKYRTNKHKYGGQAETPDGNVQVRYFIIPASELGKLGHSAASITALSYDALTNLLGTSE